MKRVLFLVSFVLMLCLFCSASESVELTKLIKDVKPSVVLVSTYDEYGKLLAQGTGFFIGENGDVATNYHVLEGAYSADVKTLNKKRYAIKGIIAEDAKMDLIIVSTNTGSENLIFLTIQTKIPLVGEQVVVVGSPLGLEQTVSEGIVSAVRDLSGFDELIQISAPISSGSSGSPVVNAKGEVIGMASMYLMGGQNLNFAIPGSNLAALMAKTEEVLILKSLADWAKENNGAYALYLKGNKYLLANDNEKALACFEKAVKTDPNFKEAWYGIGYAKNRLGHYQEALVALEIVIEIDPKYYLAYHERGLIYIWGQKDKAIEAFNKALQIKPNFAKAYMGLGTTYSLSEDNDKAIEYYNKAIEADPKLAMAYYMLGAVYSNKGDKKLALEEYKALKDLDPNLADRLFNFINKTGLFKQR